MKRKSTNTIFVSIFIVAVVLGFTIPAGAAVPNPIVTGPIPVNVPIGDPSHDYPQFATQLDLASYGYVEEEFFLEGFATRYTTPPLADGEPISTEHPYKTRMIVRRPVSKKNFNGTVLVEWLNVTSGYNLDALWLTSYAHILREGYAYVGVSVQRVGVQQPPYGLVSWSLDRYSDLDVTDGGTFVYDELSYDIWSQAAQAIWEPLSVDPLGGLEPQIVIATGASQSQGYLVRYHNSIQPLTNIFDGYLLYLGVGGLLRTDLDPKIIKLNTENDVVFLGEFFARQPDSDRLRTFEVAGASHVGLADPNLRLELLIRDDLPIADTTCTLPPFSRIPTNHVANAAFDHLTRWISTGVEPPTAPPIEASWVAPLVVVDRDVYGNALGGIQLSQHAVPTATNTGVNGPFWPSFCFLFGSHEPFDEDTLDSLYPNHGKYVSQVVQVVNENLADGYIVNFDAKATKRKAARSDIGKKRR